MKRPRKIRHEFVEFIPKEREEGVLYVSIPYATAVHSCFCGCGMKVVTPISPVGWQLNFDGETVSLHPSVGNWQFPCRSHYVIRRDAAHWAGDMSDADIAHGRARDRRAQRAYYDKDKSNAAPPVVPQVETPPSRPEKRKGFFARLFGK